MMPANVRQKAKRVTSFEATAKQREFIEKALSPEYRYLLYGGAIRGGKSYGAIAAIIMFCKMFPGSRWAIVRKDLPTIRRNVIPTFYKVRPVPFVRDIITTTWTARCENDSEILFFPENFKEDPDLERWKGLEVNGFLLEEASELSEKTFMKAIERAGSWIIPGAASQPKPLILLTANPAKNWVKRRFYDPWKSGTIQAPWDFIQATIKDNPFLPEGYLESLETLRDTDPIAYRRFVLGDWEVADDPQQLIKWEWLYKCENDVEPMSGPGRLGIDVARFGDDETVFVYMRGNEIHDIDTFKHQAIDVTAQRAADVIAARNIDPANVMVDAVGLGGGVIDLLNRLEYSVASFVSGGKPEPMEDDTEYIFKNVRSQAWWAFREAVRKEEISVTVEDPGMRQRLFEDLTSLQYSISASDKEIVVEPKDKAKKRLGRSPDLGDGAVMAYFSQHVGVNWLVD